MLLRLLPELRGALMLGVRLLLGALMLEELLRGELMLGELLRGELMLGELL